MLFTNHSRQPALILAALLLATSMTLVLLATLIHHQPVQAAPAATHISGPILTHTTWSLAGSPYIMTDSVTVNPGITLTVEPGVMVMGQQHTYLWVDGYLQAVGTITKPITFTSALDSGPGQWEWFSVGPSVGSGAYLKHVTIRYANAGLGINNFLSNKSIIIENSTLHNNGSYAIETNVSAIQNLVMTNVTFINNGYDRVQIDSSWPDHELADNTTLTAQPGLEGYEFYDDDGYLIVPSGITLTLEAGTTVIMSGTSIGFIVEGYLQSLGTASRPVTVTADNATPNNFWVTFHGGSGYITGTLFQQGEMPLVAGLLDPEGELIIQNSVFISNEMPIAIGINKLHQVQMNDISFQNNVFDRIYIFQSGISANIDEISADAVLAHYPGLEAYEVTGGPTYESSFIVPDGITLTLEPRVTLMMNEFGEFRVNGRLQSNGTPTQPVTITSVLNSGPGEWAGLIFEGGQGHLEHTTVRYGEDNMVVLSPTASLHLTNTQLIDGVNGALIQDGTVTADCSTFAHNNGDGITVLNGGSPNVTVQNSNLFNNTGEGLNNDSGIAVNALNNWWGEASGPGGLGPGSGDEVSGNTLYDPWLTTPHCLPTYTADLSVSITTTASAVVAGTAVTYTLTISNSGPQVASLIRLTNTLPAQTSLIGPPPTNCTGTASLICDFGNIPAHSIEVISYSLLLPITATGSLTNSTIITADVLDNNLANNTAVHSLPIITLPQVQFLQSDYSFHEADSPAFITLTLSLPAPLTGTIGYTITPGTAVPHDDYLPSSGTITFTPGLTTAVLPITLVDDDLLEPDETFHISLSSPQNLLLGSPLTATITIVDDDSAQADLSLGLTAFTDSVLMGEPFTYTLTISNSGPQTATAVTLTNVLPPEVTLLTAPTNCTGTHNLICTWPTLAVSSSLSLAYQVAIESAVTGTITNSATITAVTLDPELSNNTAYVTTAVVEDEQQFHVYLPFIHKP